MEHHLIVVSGHVFSGKTWYRQWIAEQIPSAFQISMDRIRTQLWGYKKLTGAQHRFKNEAVRQEIMRTFVIQRAPAIITEMVMPTNAYHQQPLVETVIRTREHLESVWRDEKEMSPVSLRLSVILLYCSVERVRQRITQRQQEITEQGNIHHADIFDFDGYLGNIKLLEIPMAYFPLYINTSDESAKSIARNKEEILQFLAGNNPVGFDEQGQRVQEYCDILANALTHRKEIEP